jgi:hypothetical protein
MTAPEHDDNHAWRTRPNNSVNSDAQLHCGHKPAPTPAGDYAPSLRSPWRTAIAIKDSRCSLSALAFSDILTELYKSVM